MSALVEASGLVKAYGRLRAVDGVHLTVMEGETLGLVGESGCGKSTLGRLLLRLVEPDEGRVRFDGGDLTSLGSAALRRRRRDMQIIFQDPFGSLNPRMTVADTVGEAYAIHGIGNRASRRGMVLAMLDMVGLPHAAADRYPHEFSGGQRQRVGIARALALRPRFVVCDEAVSALDVSVQAQVVNLLGDLQRELRLTYLFISHNLAVVRHIAARVAVMYLGRIVELAETDALFSAPAHPYTRALMSAIPPGHPDAPWPRIALAGDLAAPVLGGCRFAPRCVFVEARCRAADPPLMSLPDGRLAACHRVFDNTLPV